jgi:hypothetical protein
MPPIAWPTWWSRQHYRFDPRGDAEDNLAWSITSKLKGVGYLADYLALDDPGVQAEIPAFET